MRHSTSKNRKSGSVAQDEYCQLALCRRSITLSGVCFTLSQGFGHSFRDEQPMSTELVKQVCLVQSSNIV